VEGSYQGGVGAVIVGVFGETAMTAAAGVDGDGRPVSVDRPWMTASLAKVITATAVLRLVEAGRVDLDAPIADYFDFPMSDRITVRHVMQHESTIPNMFSHIGTCTDESTVEEIKQRANTEPAGEPGEVSEYSNTNYLLLGLLIEAVTGQDPGEYIREHIFRPLGMDSTYWYESQEGPAPWWPQPESSQGVGVFDCGELGGTIGTDGAVVTTLQDMDSFYRGLFGEDLISDETLQSMIQMDSQVFGLRYGLGIMELVDESRPDDLLYGHGGDAGWYQTAAFHDPVKGRSVVVFTTYGNEYSLLFEAIDWANQQTN
jgi:D-alanyl-D-alanine carboxypeptidase